MSDWVFLGPILVLTVALVLTACASTDDPTHDDIRPSIEDDPRFGAAVDTVCFTGGLSGFYEVGSRAIVLRRSVNDAYLLRTGYCRALRDVEGVRLPEGECLHRGGRLDVFDQPFPREGERSDAPERCLITAIHRWQDVRLDAPFYEE